MIEKYIEAETEIGKVIPQLSQIDLRRIVYYRQDIIAILQKIDQAGITPIITDSVGPHLYYCQKCHKLLSNREVDIHKDYHVCCGGKVVPNKHA